MAAGMKREYLYRWRIVTNDGRPGETGERYTEAEVRRIFPECGRMQKTAHRYLWRVIDRGRPCVTKSYVTEEQVMHDYPECTPIPLLETLQVHQVPHTAEEIVGAIRLRPSQ